MECCVLDAKIRLLICTSCSTNSKLNCQQSLKSEKNKKENESVNVSDKASVEKGKNKARDNIQCENVEDIKDQVEDEPEDDVYIIESLREKNGNQFLVKWENYPEDENTWEPRASIPDYILQVCVIIKISKLFTCILSFTKRICQGLVNLLLPRLG